jgi:formylglycine-generating enzyme required for sulfatase activity
MKRSHESALRRALDFKRRLLLKVAIGVSIIAAVGVWSWWRGDFNRTGVRESRRHHGWGRPYWLVSFFDGSEIRRYLDDETIEVLGGSFSAKVPKSGVAQLTGPKWPHSFAEGSSIEGSSDEGQARQTADPVLSTIGSRWEAESASSIRERRVGESRVHEWADVLESEPDPKVVLSQAVRESISATGLPWRVRERASGIEMLLVPPGTFVMGMSPGDGGADPQELPCHEVHITTPFYLGRFEVTVAQVQKILAEWWIGPDIFEDFETGWFLPSWIVEDVPLRALMSRGLTLEEASLVAPATMLRKGCEDFLSKTGLRLPSEAEWEFACRAGAEQPQYGPLEEIACFRGNSHGTAHPVGSWRANPLGFHDMLGNVWERVGGWYGPYSAATQIDPKGPDSGTIGVLRGGRWNSGADACRASKRLPDPTGETDAFRMWSAMIAPGFRVARNP